MNRSPLSKLPLQLFVFEVQAHYESVVNNKSFQLKETRSIFDDNLTHKLCRNPRVATLKCYAITCPSPSPVILHPQNIRRTMTAFRAA
jgi:hypothetical protein